MRIWLQGGDEFAAECRPMDAETLAAAGPGPVVVVGLAGAPGREYRLATSNGARHFRELGAGEVLEAPDARRDPDTARGMVERAGLLVLPGGSPRRLLTALTETGLADVLQRRAADGADPLVVMGSSAGAMVLGEWTVLPSRPLPKIGRGLGLAGPILVVPHWRGDDAAHSRWLRPVEQQVPADITVLGIPEHAGVVVEPAGRLRAVGVAPSRLVRSGEDLELGG